MGSFGKALNFAYWKQWPFYIVILHGHATMGLQLEPSILQRAEGIQCQDEGPGGGVDRRGAHWQLAGFCLKEEIYTEYKHQLHRCEKKKINVIAQRGKRGILRELQCKPPQDNSPRCTGISTHTENALFRCATSSLRRAREGELARAVPVLKMTTPQRFPMLHLAHMPRNMQLVRSLHL